ncbi:SGNH/GDSL hydrolase family protein [Candidatus Woesearchaeota archaeon]|nr:SGNH/GDSL hydrolase family protein [Candidatus Woesearchaeota archaeon]
MDEKYVRIIIVISAIIFSLLLMEVFFRIYFSINQDYDIEMWKYSMNHKISVDDLRSHIHLPDTFSAVMGNSIKINSKGLRDNEYDYKKLAGTYRILVIGDSITFGFGVDQNKTYPKILESLLNQNKINNKDIEVINLGIGNYNTLQELEFLKVEGIRYDPDEIILGWFINDAEYTQKERSSFFRKHSYTYTYFLALKAKSRFLYGEGYESYYKKLYEDNKFKEYKLILSSLLNYINKNNITLNVLLIPELHDLENYSFVKIHDEIIKFFEEKKVTVIDGKPSFETNNSQIFWVAKDDAHPNEEGHKILANLLYKELYSKDNEKTN